MAPNEPSTDGWSEWRHYTLAELKRLNETIEKMEKHNAEKDVWIAVEIARLKMYAATWGAAAGFIGSIVLVVSVELLLG